MSEELRPAAIVRPRACAVPGAIRLRGPGAGGFSRGARYSPPRQRHTAKRRRSSPTAAGSTAVATQTILTTAAFGSHHAAPRWVCHAATRGLASEIRGNRQRVVGRDDVGDLKYEERVSNSQQGRSNPTRRPRSSRRVRRRLGIPGSSMRHQLLPVGISRLAITLAIVKKRSSAAKVQLPRTATLDETTHGRCGGRCFVINDSPSL